MSLENKIELLTVAIERLTAMLEKTGQPEQNPPSTAVKRHQPPLSDTKPELHPEPVITVDDLQSICTGLVRTARANKPRIISVLDSFNAKVLADLKPSDYADVKECLEALKNG